MEVNPNRRATEVAKTVAPSLVKFAPQAQAHAVALNESESVNRALQQTPDVRTEKVAQAAQQVSDANYPALAMITAIAHLLAVNLDDN